MKKIFIFIVLLLLANNLFPKVQYRKKDNKWFARITNEKYKDLKKLNLIGSFNEWKIPGIPMIKNSEGIWEIEIEMIKPKYTYRFYNPEIKSSENAYLDDPENPEKVISPLGGYDFVLLIPSASQTSNTTTTTTIKRSEEEKVVLVKPQLILLKNGSIVEGTILKTDNKGITILTDEGEKIFSNKEIEKVYFNQEDYYKEKYGSKEKIVEKEKVVEKVIIESEKPIDKKKVFTITEFNVFIKYYLNFFKKNYRSIIDGFLQDKVVHYTKNGKIIIFTEQFPEFNDYGSIKYIDFSFKNNKTSDLKVVYKSELTRINKFRILLENSDFNSQKDDQYYLKREDVNIEISFIRDKIKKENEILIHFFTDNNKIAYNSKYDLAKFDIQGGLDVSTMVNFNFRSTPYPNFGLRVNFPLKFWFTANSKGSVGIGNEWGYKCHFTYGIFPTIHEFNYKLNLITRAFEASSRNSFVFELGVNVEAQYFYNEEYIVILGPSLYMGGDWYNKIGSYSTSFGIFCDMGIGANSENSTASYLYSISINVGLLWRFLGNVELLF